ncbi:glycosyltransferase family 2 protein [Salinibacter ruber]|uniref:glycosyltransferase family 2 protein n=1 Tax=Salinibacter ruber TaxID=146919 RepID=UPI0020731F07|nr:glycosyltransferase family A protein [Salinibacter ruber]MCS4116163.1 glycosyltransferase involved in cell wall biosynthesis [Salinibacter ruber]MCS4181674.1 glycosyltransferase involved in cell wall biosynthesis [Salinibacter ruber]
MAIAIENVSIVIPVKNRPELIQKTLRSVLAQTYPHWETVVVDDQSTDETREVVAAMAADDDRIRLLRRTGEKGGASVCRNVGWRNARGEYIIFLDSDDLLAEDCLGQRVRFMEHRPELDFAVFGGRLFDEVPGDRDKVFNMPIDKNPLDRFLRLDLPWQTTGPIYRRSAVEKIGGWNEELSCGQDVDYGVRSLCHDLQFHYTDTVDYYRRMAASRQEAIGADPWNPDRLPTRQKRVEATRRILSETGNLTESRKLMIAGNFLHLAECWAEEGRIGRARVAWRGARDLDVVSEKVFRFIDLYLKCHQTLWARYMAYYMCRRFPPELILSGFSTQRDPNEEPKSPEEYPLLDHRNPYFRHAFILIQGPIGYTLRQLVSALGATSLLKSLKKELWV